MKFSVIIPTFNGEKYIERCLFSILNQSISPAEYEIIVVDDGSTDQTIPIVLNICQKSSHVILITQKNKNGGGARNTGLQRARGDYVLFVDQDDYLVDASLHQLVSIANEHGLDVLMANYYNHKPGEKPIEHQGHNKNVTDVMSGKAFLKINTISCFVWTYLFKRDFLNKQQLLFRENISFVDVDFSARAVFYAQKIKYINLFFTHWVANPNSFTRSSWTNQKSQELLIAANELHVFTTKVQNADQEDYFFLQQYAYSIYWTLLKNSTSLGLHQTLEICDAMKKQLLGIPASHISPLYFRWIMQLIWLNTNLASLLLFCVAWVRRLFPKS